MREQVYTDDIHTHSTTTLHAVWCGDDDEAFGCPHIIYIIYTATTQCCNYLMIHHPYLLYELHQHHPP